MRCHWKWYDEGHTWHNGKLHGESIYFGRLGDQLTMISNMVRMTH